MSALTLSAVMACTPVATAATAQAVAPPLAESLASPRLLSLRELLDSVREHHPAVQAARARVRAARGSRTAAGVFGNPTLTFDVENAPLPGGVTPPMDREAMTTIMVPLEPLYQRRARVRRADADVRAAEADAIVARQRVALAAARAYYRTALSQVGVDVARDLAGWLDTVVAYNRLRVTEGVSAEADLLRSELERDRTTAEASMQEADLVRARAELAAFLGEVDLQSLRVRVDDAPVALPSMFKGGQEDRIVASASRGRDLATPDAVTHALAERPQLRAARERVTSASAGVASERTMLFRQAGAMVGTKQSGGTTSLIAGVSVPLPLFDQNRGEVARATAEREAAALDLVAEERSARAEIVGAYEAARLLTDRAAALAAKRGDGSSVYLARADEARRIALGAYREGAVPLLSVIDAARAWGEARVAYYQTLFAQHESVLALLAAEGADLATALSAPSTGAPR